MAYAFVEFTPAGKILRAHVPSGTNSRTNTAEYAAFIGYGVRLSNVLFRGDKQGTTGRILLACGPFEGPIEATQYAARVQSIADHVSTIVELLGEK
jgi:hypothetical protein